MSALLLSASPRVAVSKPAPAADYVALPGGSGGVSDDDSPAYTERRAVERRLRDAALQAVAGGTPIAAVPLLLLLPGLLVLKGATAVALVSALFAGLLGLGWSAFAWAVNRRVGWIGDTRQQRLVIGALSAGCVAAMLLLSSLPDQASWLHLPFLPALPVLATLAPLAAFVLAPMPESRLPLALLMFIPAAMSVWGGGMGGGAGWFELLSCLTLGAGSALLTLWRSRHWAEDQRALIRRDDRIRELEAACDLARRAEQEKTRFLASASHDLRQPMHALGLFAATLEKRLIGSTEEPLVHNVMRSVDGLERSFNVMLDVSRLDAGTVDPNIQHFPLRDLFRRLHMQYSGQAEQAGLGLRFSPGGKSVSSDPQLLERILGNLIQNAIKYTDEGGIVVVARSTATHVNVEVWDTGVGISADDLPRVFDEFCQVGHDRRARAQGLGMGLAIVKRLARLLGHRLSVRSRPGGGTMFRIGIQIGGLPGIQDATAAADTLPMPILEPCSVLVIDDEAPIRESLRILLEEWGYEVVCAATAQQAEAAVHTLPLPPDLILSDLHLGPGPDGIAAIDTVRRVFGYAVPAILVTGDTSHEEMRRASDSGHMVLFKPLQARKLFNALHGLGR